MAATERQSFETLDTDDLEEVAQDESGLRRMPSPPKGLWSDTPPPLPPALPPPLPTKADALAREESERVDFDDLLEDLVSRPAPKPTSDGWELSATALPPPAPVPAIVPRRARGTWAAAAAVGLAAFALGLGTMWLVQRPDEAAPLRVQATSEPAAGDPVVIEPVVIEAAAEVIEEASVELPEAPVPIAAPPSMEPARAVAPRRGRTASREQRPREEAVERAPERVIGTDLPESPAREDVLAAMAAAEPAIEACASDADRGQLARVRFSFSSDGRPVHTNVQGVSGPTASCIARAARTVRVPAFARDRFVIEFPFQL